MSHDSETGLVFRTVNKILGLVRKDIFEQKGVHPDDLDQFLRTIGKLEQIENGEIGCDACNEVLSKNNIGKIAKRKGNVKLFCDSYICYVENHVHTTEIPSDQEYLDLAKHSDNIEEINKVEVDIPTEAPQNPAELNSD